VSSDTKLFNLDKEWKKYWKMFNDRQFYFNFANFKKKNLTAKPMWAFMGIL
jgi:hypothetical protein